MPRTLNLLLLASALAAPVCATPTAAPAARQNAPTTTQQPPAADEELERARGMLARGEAAAAVAALKPLAERRKTDADVWYYLGFALTRAGKPKDGHKAFESALKLRPDSAQARAGLAYALLLLDKPKDAEREAALALAAAPQQAAAHYVVAALRFREERFTEAVREAWASLRADPEFSAALRIAGDALLNAYYVELSRQARLYPISPGAGKEEIQLMTEKREPALAPFKEGLRDLAGRLEALAAAHPNAPEAAALREQADTLRISGRRPGERAPGDIYSSTEVTTRALITYKPEPGFSGKARSRDTTGTVRLRAVLGSDGQIRNITVIKRLPNGLTEKAIEAARKIKFKPATLDGRPVSQAVVLEYNFSIIY
ncbi:MAG: TonB family protein [Pyrinomonadaceae bacterium]